MPSAADRLEFAPPPQPALVRAFLLALVAHILLLAALTWGVSWKRENQDAAVDAELWASVPQQAAPKEVAPPPPPPQPVVKPEPRPEPPQPTEAEIALEKQKKLAEAKKREEELERKKEEAAKRKADEQKAALEKKRKEEAERNRRELEELKLAKAREDRIKALQGMAGATGAPGSTGTAQRASGPSDSWAGRIRARVRPNIVFHDDIVGNPSADVEVRLAPDGTIIGKRIVKPSGNRAWDEAVLRALDKTEVLPRDTDGRVHSPVVIEFKPRG